MLFIKDQFGNIANVFRVGGGIQEHRAKATQQVQ